MLCERDGLLATATSCKHKRATVSEMRPRRGARSCCGASSGPALSHSILLKMKIERTKIV